MYKYQVQEFAAGKWWPVRSFALESDAAEFARKLQKGRVVRLR